MHYVRRYGKYFLIIIFPAICWLLTNSIINGHYHKLDNGEIIYHCHPFKHNKNNNSPFEDHHHTESEFYIIAQISNPIFILSVFLILIAQLLTLCSEIIISENLYLLLKNYFFNNNYRSPPIYNYCKI